MFRLDNKIAVITGGGSGIGKAISTTFARQGAVVYILEMDEKGAASTVEEITTEGGKGSFFKCNIADQHEVKAVIAQITREHPAIHILVNNAGIAHIGQADTTAEADFDRVVAVNIKGVYNCLHETIPFMKQKGGSILNMASIAALVGIPDRFVYSAAKGAVVAATKALAQEIGKRNVTVNAVAPGFIASDMTAGVDENELRKLVPLNRFGEAQEVAELVTFLASKKSSYITGEVININGGLYS